MDPVVDAPEKAVGVALDAGFSAPVPRAHQFLGIHLQVAIGVAHQPDVWRLQNEDAVVEDLHGTRLHEAVGEDCPLVQLPVVVGVLEHDDAPDGIQIGLRRLKVADEFRIFDDPQPTIRIPIDGNRILNERLARHEFDVIARRHEERLQSIRRGKRRRFVRHLLHTWWPGAIDRRALIAVHAQPGRDDHESGNSECPTEHTQPLGAGRGTRAPRMSASSSSFVQGRARPAVSARTFLTAAGSTGLPVWPHSRRMYVNTAAI